MPAPDDLAQRLDAAAGPAPDVDEGLASVRARLANQPGQHVAGARRWRRPVLVAAASLLLVGAAVAVSIGRDDPATSVRTDGGDATASPPGPVTFEVLEMASSDGQRMGTLRAATDQDALDRLWADTGTNSPTPTVDLARQVVVSITIPDDACPPKLDGFDRRGTTLEPRFVEPAPACNEPLIPKTYVVALDWASTGPSFRLFLPGQPTYDFDDTSLIVTRPLTNPPVEDPEATTPSTTVPDPTDCKGPPGSATDLDGQPDWKSDGARPWTDRSGCLIRVDVLVDMPGAEHCGCEEADVLVMSAKLGERYRTPTYTAVSYVRDPKGVYDLPDVTAAFEPEATLPESAVDTGYRRDGIELHLDPADPSAVWLSYPDGHVELWPLADLPLCA